MGELQASGNEYNFTIKQGNKEQFSAKLVTDGVTNNIQNYVPTMRAKYRSASGPLAFELDSSPDIQITTDNLVVVVLSATITGAIVTKGLLTELVYDINLTHKDDEDDVTTLLTGTITVEPEV